ncbi:unnamed protein product [Diamesa hyperborea]
MDNKQLFLLVLFVLIQNISKVSLARRDKQSVDYPDETSKSTEDKHGLSWKRKESTKRMKNHKRNDVEDEISEEEYISEEYGESVDASYMKVDLKPTYLHNKTPRKPNKNKPGKSNKIPRIGKKHRRDDVDESYHTSDEESVDATFNKPTKLKKKKPRKGKKHRRNDGDEDISEEEEVPVDIPEEDEDLVDNPEEEVLVDISDVASVEIPDIESVEITASAEIPGDAVDSPEEIDVTHEIPVDISGEAVNTPNKTLIPPKDMDDENLFRGNAFEGFDERKIEFIKESFSKHNKAIPPELENMIRAAEEPQVDEDLEEANNQPIEETDDANDDGNDEETRRTNPVSFKVFH